MAPAACALTRKVGCQRRASEAQGHLAESVKIDPSEAGAVNSKPKSYSCFWFLGLLRLTSSLWSHESSGIHSTRCFHKAFLPRSSLKSARSLLHSLASTENSASKTQHKNQEIIKTRLKTSETKSKKLTLLSHTQEVQDGTLVYSCQNSYCRAPCTPTA